MISWEYWMFLPNYKTNTRVKKKKQGNSNFEMQIFEGDIEYTNYQCSLHERRI
jgi:hypothetical protein